MKNEKIFFWCGAILGLLVAGEALALLIGMNALSSENNAWTTTLNNTLAGIDVFTGVLLLLLIFLRKEKTQIFLRNDRSLLYKYCLIYF